MLFNILLTANTLVCIALIAVVLLQRSEGGALGMGGGPTGFMTARGAGDLLTRTTWILFTLFLVLCIGLTLIGARAKNASSVAERLKIAPVDTSTLAPKPSLPTTATPPALPSTLPSNAGQGLPASLTAPSAGPQTGLPGVSEAAPAKKPAPKP